jgi:predicted phosphate transport protein (TIGR00153 family)
MSQIARIFNSFIKELRMFGIKLWPQEYGFFDLFSRQARVVLDGAKCFNAILAEWPDVAGRARRLDELEHECDAIARMTIDLLRRTFITPLDREEIMSLTSNLDDVIDAMEAAARRMILFEIKELPKTLKEMAHVLEKAVGHVAVAVDLLKGMKEVGQLQETLKEIHYLENEGDGLLRAGLAEMFRQPNADPLNVIKLKDIYDTVERAIDQCQRVGNIIEGIILEHQS